MLQGMTDFVIFSGFGGNLYWLIIGLSLNIIYKKNKNKLISHEE